jgi:prepilin-type N-terminal cleavage/methylation domain-containing protein
MNMSGQSKKGFTLIELLVVIAIIAVLMGILMPSLRAAKQQAAAANCMANSRSLSFGWVMYAQENDNSIVPASMGNNAWIGQPQAEDGTLHTPTQASPMVLDEDEIRGIKKGLLYPYLKDAGAYHCPADNMRISKYDGSKVFVSYGLADCLNGRDPSFKRQIKKIHQIKNASKRYNFVETAETRNFNSAGHFVIGAPEYTGLKTWSWWSPMAVHHNKASVLGFCDGHAEKHKWVDKFTIDRVQKLIDQNVDTYGQEPGPPDQQQDLKYMADGWAYRY